MSASLPGTRALPQSKYDLGTYWGRVRQSTEITDMRTLFATSDDLENAKKLIIQYKTGQMKDMTPQLWKAKKTVDSTLHPDTGEPVFLPFRMSCFVLSNLVVTAGMLTPGLKTPGTVLWQLTNQTLNVCINYSNANKSTPLPWTAIANSYLLAVSASCSVAVGLNSLVPRLKSFSPATITVLGRLVPFAAVASAGALNVFLMRGEEIRRGIDVFPSRPLPSSSASSSPDHSSSSFSDLVSKANEQASSSSPPPTEPGSEQSLGKSRKAATLAVSETAVSRVLNATPIMVLPPLILVQLQRTRWLKSRPRMILPLNLGLILTTSIFALPLALGAFPQRQSVRAETLEKEFHGRGGKDGKVEFNRGI